MMPSPQIAITCGWRLGFEVSSMKLWLSGGMNAPLTPCRARNSTISPRFCAIPHIIEARMNPTTEKMKRRLAPTRSLSQPVAGIATALAMM